MHLDQPRVQQLAHLQLRSNRNDITGAVLRRPLRIQTAPSDRQGSTLTAPDPGMLSWDPKLAVRPAARSCGDCDDQVFMVPSEFVRTALAASRTFLVLFDRGWLEKLFQGSCHLLEYCWGCAWLRMVAQRLV